MEQTTNTAPAKKSKGFRLFVDGTPVGFLTISDNLPAASQEKLSDEAKMRAVLAADECEFKPYGEVDTKGLDALLS